MKSLKFLLATLVLTGCASAPPRGDVILATSPTIAANGAALVEALHLSWPVYIVDDGSLVDSGYLGMTQFEGMYYLISLRSDLDDATKWTVLEHELGHVVAWDTDPEYHGGHGPAWGLAMARVHRLATGELP